MKTLEMAAKIKRLADRIEKLTDQNDHTGAALSLAFELGGKFPRLMQAIETIHDIEGGLPYEICKYRSYILDEMLNDADRQWGKEAAQIIKQAF